MTAAFDLAKFREELQAWKAVVLQQEDKVMHFIQKPPWHFCACLGFPCAKYICDVKGCTRRAGFLLDGVRKVVCDGHLKEFAAKYAAGSTWSPHKNNTVCAKTRA